MKPTDVEIKNARQVLEACGTLDDEHRRIIYRDEIAAIRVLLAATEAQHGRTQDTDRLERLRENLLLCAREGSIDPSEVDEYVRLTTPDPGPPRPDDMVELARLVAVELRKPAYGKFAAVFDNGEPNRHITVWVMSVLFPYERLSIATTWKAYSMFSADFDNLTPREIAIAIQAKEAERVAQWAGNK